MQLILRTLNYQGQPPSEEISAQFDTLGGSIGRAPNNHLVLPDPEKFISRLHATILFEAGQFFIQDSSTGGTYLTDCDMLLHETRAALHDGEKLRIGEYELLVSIPGSTRHDDVSSFETPPIVRQLDLAENSLLQSSVLDGPFAQPQSNQPDTNFYSSFVEQPESSPIHQSFTLPGVEQAPANPTDDDLDFGDLLSKLETLPGSVSSSSGAAAQPDFPELPADFFADDVSAPENSVQPGVGLDAPWPKASEISEAEPESLGAAESAPLAMLTPEPPAFQQNQPASVFQEPPTHSSEALAPEIIVRPQPARPHQTAVSVAPQSSPVEHQTPSAVPPSRPSSDTDQGLMCEFLAGAGISDPNFLPSEQWPVLMRTSGELLRNMVEGLMRVLRARAELKSQFRVSVTTMRSIDNNPLKFTPNVDDAMKLILAPTNPGFLPPAQAVSEGFNDIMNHQIAMTAGIQAALAEILRSFDPQLIEKTQAEGVLFQKKAKCWEYYVDKYPQLKAVAQEEFFGDAFADAYEKQMLLLSRSSKKQ